MPETSEKTVQFHLADFDGPLDLLLALVAKNKMSIYDIEIIVLIDQYLEVMQAAGSEAERMESASEFITMAARLVQTKSALLLPRSDEGERMREELTGLLVEYSACKAVAGKLKEMAAGVYLAVRRPMQVELDSTYTGSHDVSELAAAFAVMQGRGKLRRAPQRERFDEIVAAPFVSVTGRVISVLRGLVTGRIQRLRELFRPGGSRGETVATFLALLELIRGGRVAIGEGEELSLKKGGRKNES